MSKTFSLCHATARLPDGWRAAHDSWQQNCDNWDEVEYVLGVDWEDRCKWVGMMVPPYMRRAVNYKNQCAVAGWNAAGKGSTKEWDRQGVGERRGSETILIPFCRWR